VFFGVAAAFGVHVVIAVAIGGVFALLPQRLVLFVAAALFAGGAAWLLLGRAEDEAAAEASRAAGASQGSLRIAVASFGVVFVGEWGDITQITTANLAARYGDPVSVGVGPCSPSGWSRCWPSPWVAASSGGSRPAWSGG
jgi:Ca2+/H+ antiporter, TMEM165/GDT1 family